MFEYLGIILFFTLPAIFYYLARYRRYKEFVVGALISLIVSVVWNVLITKIIQTEWNKDLIMGIYIGTTPIEEYIASFLISLTIVSIIHVVSDYNFRDKRLGDYWEE